MNLACSTPVDAAHFTTDAYKHRFPLVRLCLTGKRNQLWQFGKAIGARPYLARKEDSHP